MVLSWTCHGNIKVINRGMLIEVWFHRDSTRCTLEMAWELKLQPVNFKGSSLEFSNQTWQLNIPYVRFHGSNQTWSLHVWPIPVMGSSYRPMLIWWSHRIPVTWIAQLQRPPQCCGSGDPMVDTVDAVDTRKMAKNFGERSLFRNCSNKMR